MEWSPLIQAGKISCLALLLSRGITASSRSTLICRPGLPWPHVSEPLLKPSFPETPHPCPADPAVSMVHRSPIELGLRPLPSHTHLPWASRQVPCPRLRRQAPLHTSVSTAPTGLTAGCFSGTSHQNTLSCSPSETDSTGRSGEGRASHPLLTAQPGSAEALLTAPSPLPLSPHLRPCFWFPQAPQLLQLHHHHPVRPCLSLGLQQKPPNEPKIFPDST